MWRPVGLKSASRGEICRWVQRMRTLRAKIRRRARRPPAYNGLMPTKDQILDALRSVIDPELRRDIVELEMVRSIDVHDNGVVDVMVSLTTPGCPIRSHFQTGVDQAVRELDGVTG